MTYGEFVKFAADETRQMRAAAAETKAAEKTARAAARAEEKLAMKRAIGERSTARGAQVLKDRAERDSRPAPLCIDRAQPAVGTVSEVGGAQHFRGSTEGRPIGTEALELPPGIRTGVVGSFSMTVANAGDGGVFLGMGTAPKGEPISQIPVEVNSTVAVLHTASRKLHVGGVESIRHEGPDRLPAGTYHFYKYENAVREPHVPGKMSVKSIIGSTLIAVLPESVPGSRLVLVGTSSKVLHSSIRGVAATIGDEDEVHVGGQVKKVEHANLPVDDFFEWALSPALDRREAARAFFSIDMSERVALKPGPEFVDTAECQVENGVVLGATGAAGVASEVLQHCADGWEASVTLSGSVEGCVLGLWHPPIGSDPQAQCDVANDAHMTTINLSNRTACVSLQGVRRVAQRGSGPEVLHQGTYLFKLAGGALKLTTPQGSAFLVSPDVNDTECPRLVVATKHANNQVSFGFSRPLTITEILLRGASSENPYTTPKPGESAQIQAHRKLAEERMAAHGSGRGPPPGMTAFYSTFIVSICNRLQKTALDPERKARLLKQLEALIECKHVPADVQAAAFAGYLQIHGPFTDDELTAVSTPYLTFTPDSFVPISERWIIPHCKRYFKAKMPPAVDPSRPGIQGLVRRFVELQVKLAAANPQALAPVIDVNCATHRPSFLLALKMIHLEGTWGVFLDAAEQVTASVKSRFPNGPIQITNTLDELFVHASAVAGRYAKFMSNFAACTGGDFLEAPIKNPVRAIEKIELQQDETLRGKFEKACDITRGGLKYKNTGQLVQALQLLMGCDKAEKANTTLTPALLGSGAEDLVLVRIKNRFGQPNASGYADALVNAYFANDPNRHIFEIQLMHDALYTVRKDQGAHSFYNRSRTASEILETLGHEDLTPTVPIDIESPPRTQSGAAAESELFSSVQALSGKLDAHTAQLTEMETRSKSGPSEQEQVESTHRREKVETLEESVRVLSGQVEAHTARFAKLDGGAALGDAAATPEQVNALLERVRGLEATVSQQGQHIQKLESVLESVLQQIGSLRGGTADSIAIADTSEHHGA